MTRISNHGRKGRVSALLALLSVSLSGAAAFSTTTARIRGLATRSTGPASSFTTRNNQHDSPAALKMVLTTPESIIEQASTQKLIDDLIDECVRTSARRPIMLQFDPSSNWIWKRWKGTIFSETWDSVIRRMAYATVVLIICHSFPKVKTWLSGFGILWGHLLTVTTFTLTFFVNQSYSLWRKCYELSRRLQGRLHDINLTLAAHAVRKPPANPNEASTYTAGSRQVLELVSRYIRLFNILTYGSFTRSHRPILTPRGMRRLVERGLMTASEREILVDAEIPATQRHTAVLLWIVRTFVEGREAGHFLGGAGFEEQILEKVHVTRAQYGAIGDELQGRLPLAYAHIVQVLVDIILWMYPWMGYSSGMSPLIAIVGTGLLTVSYQGLFDLAKQFLDPYDNESYGKGEDPLVVDTLIAETNAGSVRWLNGLEQYPVSHQRIKEGELSDMLLPVRGYTVEEAEEIEAERLRKERERFEMKAREEAERQQLELEARYLRAAAEAMIPAQATEVAVSEGLFSKLEIAVQPNPRVDKGLHPPRNMESIQFTTGSTVSDILSYMPSFGSTIANDILPKGIPLATEPTAFASVGLMEASPSSAQASRVSRGSATISPTASAVDNTCSEALEATHVVLNGASPTSLSKSAEWPSNGAVEEVVMSQHATGDSEPDTADVPELQPSDEQQLEAAKTILNGAEAEKLETEAILNAPPGADNIEVLERMDDVGSSVGNMTDDEESEVLADADSLDSKSALVEESHIAETGSADEAVSQSPMEVIMMSNLTDVNAPVLASDESTLPPAYDISTAKTALTLAEEALAEQLETEAILNAPPAADNIEILEKKEEPASLLANSTSVVDELAVLEMDEPANSTMATAELAIDGEMEPQIAGGGETTMSYVPLDNLPATGENSNVGELYGPPIKKGESASDYSP